MKWEKGGICEMNGTDLKPYKSFISPCHGVFGEPAVKGVDVVVIIRERWFKKTV